MFVLSKRLKPYFSDEAEFKKAELPIVMLLCRFPGSEIRLKNQKHTVFINWTDLDEIEVKVPEVIEPTHAEIVQTYFAEKEKQADAIFEEASKELEKLGKQELIKKLRTAVTFYESGDWIDDDGLARKQNETRT